MKRKSILKLLTLTLASVMLAGSLTACGASDTKSNNTKQEEEKEDKKNKKEKDKEEDQTENDGDEDQDLEDTDDIEDADNDSGEEIDPITPGGLTDLSYAELMNGYAGMLTTISMLGQLPENKYDYSDDYEYYYNLLSEYASYDYETGEVSTCNHYSIADVDSDGIDELIVYIDTDNASMADMCSRIYQYNVDTRDFTLETVCWITPEFYEGGYIIDSSSHNQTYGEMWPYTVEKYNPETDTYDYVAYAYSWDKELLDADSEPFPDDIDEDGDGTVYAIMDENYETTYVDNAEFEKWEKQFKSGAQITTEVYPLLYSEYSPITKDYIDLCMMDGLASQSSAVELDLGRLFTDADSYSEYYVYYDDTNPSEYYVDTDAALIAELEPFYIDKGLTSEEYEEEITYIDRKGDIVVTRSMMDAGSLTLKEKVDGLYMFGIQPGMSMDAVEDILDTYHAHAYNEDYYNEYDGLTYKYYMIGSDASFIFICVGVDSDGMVQQITTSTGCSFAG